MASQIVSNARRLAFFAENNRAESLEMVRFKELRTDLPPRFNFTSQILNLNVQIQQWIERDPLTPPEKVFALAVRHSLENAVENRVGLLGQLVPHLNNISYLAHTYIPINPPNLPLPQPPQDPASPFSEADLVSEWGEGMDLDGDFAPEVESVPEEAEVPAPVINDSVAAELERGNRNKAIRVYHTQANQMELIDSMIAELKSFPQPNIWKESFDEYEPSLYQAFPGLLEGRLIQLNGKSYAEYVESKPNCALTPEEFEAIRSMTFRQLADEMGSALDLSEALSSRMAKLVTLGNNMRQENEFLLTLGMKRQKEIVRQQNLILQIGDMSEADIQRELEQAMKSESVLFIRTCIQDFKEKIPKEFVKSLTIWLAARGQNNLLLQLVTHRRADIPMEIWIEALDRAHFWGHTIAYKLLFDRYPHRKPGGARTLLFGFAQRGTDKGLAHLLSSEYPHGFSANTIDKAFSLVLEKRRYNCFKTFFEAGVSPHDHTLAQAFKKICQSQKMEFLEPFIQPEIMARIPEAKQDLNRALEVFCQNEDYGDLPFFLKPEIAVHIETDRVWELIESFVNNETLEHEELSAYLESFFASSLFDRFTNVDLQSYVTDAGKAEDVALAEVFLNSRRGAEIDQVLFEEILAALNESKKSGVMIKLMDHPRYQAFHKPFLNQILLQTIEENGPIELIRKVISKGVLYPDLCNLFIEAAKKNRTDIMELCLQQDPASNLSSVPNDVFVRGVFAALTQGNLAFAEKLAQNRVFYSVDTDLLNDRFFAAAEAGNLNVLTFLCRHFKTFVGKQLMEAAYDRAEVKGHDAACAFLWSKIYQAAALRPDLDPDLQDLEPVKKISRT